MVPDTIIGVLGFMGVVALVLVLVSNGGGSASVINSITGGYSNIIRAATGRG